MSTITCNDWTDKAGGLHKGCGVTLRWPTDQEKAAGLKRPLNPNGTKHECAKAASQPPTAAKSNGYYDDIAEVKVIEDEKVANEALKSVDGWTLLAIKERTIVSKSLSGQPQTIQGPVFVFGRRKA